MKLLYRFDKKDYPVNSKVTLPVGIKKARFMFTGDYSKIKEIGSVGTQPMNVCYPIKFPIINGKSPNTFTIEYWETTSKSLYIFIDEIGGIPDPNYFSDEPPIIPDTQTEQEESKDAI